MGRPGPCRYSLVGFLFSGGSPRGFRSWEGEEVKSGGCGSKLPCSPTLHMEEVTPCAAQGKGSEGLERSSDHQRKMKSHPVRLAVSLSVARVFLNHEFVSFYDISLLDRQLVNTSKQILITLPPPSIPHIRKSWAGRQLSLHQHVFIPQCVCMHMRVCVREILGVFRGHLPSFLKQGFSLDLMLRVC